VGGALGELPMGAGVGTLFVVSAAAAMAEYDFVGEEDGSLRREAEESVEVLSEEEEEEEEEGEPGNSSPKKPVCVLRLEEAREDSKGE